MTACAISDCTNASKAKGLCSTHYNQTLPGRHRKVLVTCDQCAGPCLKEQRAQRYGGRYCSQICRDIARWGAATCQLPADHWARMWGKKCKWTPPREQITERECAWCGDMWLPERITGKYCTARCLTKAKRSARRAREYGAHGTYRWSEVVKLWMLFDKRCAYCDEPVALDDMQTEHVVPLSRSGANNITNLLPSCFACNADKRDLFLNEWAEDRASRNKPPRRTTWSNNDRRFIHLTSTDGATGTPRGLHVAA